MMKMFVALLVLIACSTSAQACWPPANVVENPTKDVEPVKVVEPVDDTQDDTQDVANEEQEVDESDESDESTESDDVEETEVEVAAPVADTTDETTSEESEVVETPAAETLVEETETETEVTVPRSSGYGEAHIVEITTTESIQAEDGESHPVKTEPVTVTSISSNSAVEQNDGSNVTAVSTGSTNGSYVPVGIALIMMILIAAAIYYTRK